MATSFLGRLNILCFKLKIRIQRTFSYGHCVVCSSVFFLWPLCCLFFCLFLMAIVLSVLLSFSYGHCVVCSSVFFLWPLCCPFFCDLRIMVTPLVSSNSSNSVYVMIIISFKCGKHSQDRIISFKGGWWTKDSTTRTSTSKSGVKPHATNRLYPRTSTFLTDVISENAGIGNRF